MDFSSEHMPFGINNSPRNPYGSGMQVRTERSFEAHHPVESQTLTDFVGHDFYPADIQRPDADNAG